MSGAPTALSLTWEELARISPLQPPSAGHAICGLLPQHEVEPRTSEELAAILKWANANRAAVAARGGGSKLEWGNPPRALDLVVSTRALNRVVEHAFDDMTATVEPGCTVADFQRTLAEHGQRLALDPLFPERATIGGVLATNDSGALRTRFGSLRDLIIGITAALPDGTLARSGGKVVKNVAGYDLAKLFTGSLGTLGIIAQATFRLHPLPAAVETFTAKFSGMREANQLILALLDSTLAPAAIQLRSGHRRESYVDVRYEGIPAGIEAQIRRTEKLFPPGAEPTSQQPEPFDKLRAGRGSPVREALSSEPWQAREELWMRADTACICKFGVLPAQIAAMGEQLDQAAADLKLDWTAVAQAAGIGLLRLEGDAEPLAMAMVRLRGQFEAAGGSLVLLRGPHELRGRVEAWGSAGSALSLMRRVKEQFDPAGILNPGRFVGGI